jgi:hypothetical protein
MEVLIIVIIWAVMTYLDREAAKRAAAQEEMLYRAAAEGIKRAEEKHGPMETWG